VNVSETALQAAVLKALLDEISARVKVTKAQAEAAFKETGTTGTVPTLPDGTKVATVTYAGGDSKSAYVLDANAFDAWVMKEHPEQMELVVRDSYRKGLLDAAEKAGQAIDPTTGETVPGIAVKDSTPYVSIRFKPGAREAVAQAWRTGELAGIDLVTPAAVESGEAA
jgi:hypothetical protein